MANSAWRRAENITFRNLTIGNGHGLAIGATYAMAGIKNITFQDIVMYGSDRLDTGPNLITDRGVGGIRLFRFKLS